MSKIFDSIQINTPSSNMFDMSHDTKTSMKMGDLIPIMVMEAVPGDKFNIGAESLIRFAPLVSPVMHKMDVSIHYFAVPNRLLWDNWEPFITNKATHAFPTLTAQPGSTAIGTLANYLGLPVITNVSNARPVSALPFAAYQMIYNEWYRDQNLIPPVDYKLINGNNDANAALNVIRKRAWEHDYFTSALPFAQQGAPVSIPLGNVEINPNWVSNPDYPRFISTSGNVDTGGVENLQGLPIDQIVITGGTGQSMAYDPQGSLQVGSTTINDLRRSFRLQEWLEKSMRSGQRYIENILAHFGVKSSDARLNRPEYITGTKSPVVISEVLNTTGETSATTGLPQGNMAGHAVSVNAANGGSYFFEEHGYVIGIISVMPKTSYYQGVPKHFLKNDALDFYWPSFAHLGEQEILMHEVMVNHSNPEGVFGYIPRYSEYKYQPSRVTGSFQDTLDFWTLARNLPTTTALNQAFIECNPRTDVFAVDDGSDYLFVHVFNKLKVVRRMPIFGTPTY